MISLSYFVTARDIVIEVFQHETNESTIFDIIDDLRLNRMPDHSDEQHTEAALTAVSEMASKHGVGLLDIRYDTRGEKDEDTLFG